tara:strand:- start:10875 stop:12260 length:1386 start_codon:yes stop_codon:yes gene_type:complete
MEKQSENVMDKLLSLAKRRGFIYPSSEIYGGFAGVYDYGPIGVLLAENIKKFWWKKMVQERADIVGLDAAIVMNPKVWEASGHTSGFSDPLVECRKCNTRHRADHLLEEIGVTADEKMSDEEINELFDKHKENISCPNCGNKDFTQVRSFNLLVSSNIGNFADDTEVGAYLRGETAQGIYVNFKNVLQTSNMKLPFGIAQIGKAFRNEITPRQSLIRTREFEQMEMQYFTYPNGSSQEFEKLREYRYQTLLELGIKKENIRWTEHDNLVFYAKKAFDIEYHYPSYGWKELEGVHHRGDYDLTQHAQASGVDLTYFDEEKNEKFIPHIVESSIGVGRLFLAILADAYRQEQVGDEERVVLSFNKHIAPVQIAILPLSKKQELTEPAKEVFNTLSKNFMCQYDETQSIGKRYRRQDEIGTPYCITYDFESIEDGMVTVRDRDSMEQERVSISELSEYLTVRFK